MVEPSLRVRSYFRRLRSSKDAFVVRSGYLAPKSTSKTPRHWICQKTAKAQVSLIAGIWTAWLVNRSLATDFRDCPQSYEALTVKVTFGILD